MYLPKTPILLSKPAIRIVGYMGLLWLGLLALRVVGIRPVVPMHPAFFVIFSTTILVYTFIVNFWVRVRFVLGFALVSP